MTLEPSKGFIVHWNRNDGHKGEPPSISQTVNFANFVKNSIQIWCICLQIDKYVIICQASQAEYGCNDISINPTKSDRKAVSCYD